MTMGTTKNCHPGNFSLRKPKTQFPVRFILVAYAIENGGAGLPVPHEHLEFFEVPYFVALAFLAGSASWK